ncbi:integrin beta-PS-like isoform X1 [Lycorma delicatula]|uniref:integrin beta-PS-like isoform X1 n=1 Tax=Lycorma delicatula TaxID=130591 RepID=UPI003F516BBC
MERMTLLPRWYIFTSLIFYVFILSCYNTIILVNGQATQNPCSIKQTCHECIQTPSCAWCSQPDFGEYKRCFQPLPAGSTTSSGTSSSSSSTSTGSNVKQCKEEFVYNPQNEYATLIAKSLTKTSGAGAAASRGTSSATSVFTQTSSSSSSSSSSFSSSSSSSSQHQEVVQIYPQKIQLKLRLNKMQKITFFYEQAEDYPVDLYYLMDLSQSMKDDKDNLSKLGDELASNMMSITSNFRLGFGSFVDKVVMPYVSTVPENLVEPCSKCEAPYGFQNVMSLSTNTSRFSGEVRDAAVSGNLDAPEGGFDAIMQAVVCRNQIGWREKARRLLVFSTDAGFHYAGDGKLGGIVKPNDGQCHLSRDGVYTHSTIQDYPSISQVNLKVKQNSINVIFAVTAEEFEVYDRLSKHIEGSSSGQLTNDSSNVVHLVREQYEKISSSVEMKDTASSALKVSYFSKCLNQTDLQQTNKCDGLKVGNKVQFEANIELKECPKNPSEWNQTFFIYPVGINESLAVNVEMLCDCPCEHPGHPFYEEHSDRCSGYGTYKCGLCECDDLHFGRRCECDVNNIRQGIGEDLTAGCRPDNTTTVDCSGRGQCICGQCECETRADPDEQITGPYCECDNFSCDRNDGLLCSGEDHGTCECGKCVCKPGWTHGPRGEACDCWSGNDTCIAPGSTEICSGHGTCVCGQCKCDEDEQGRRHSGHFCEKCTTCPGRCQELKDCVMCRAYKTGPLTEEECLTNCTWFELILVDQVKMDEQIHENICFFDDENDCRFEFVYSYDKQGKIIVEAQKEPQCPPQVFILGIVLGVIGAIVLIGLALLLVWKMLTTIQDRREFAKFEKQRAMAKWNTDENPIYRQATSTFKNPTYAGK